MYNKTIIKFGFRMISWIIKTSCLCYLPQPSASADNTDFGFDNSWYDAQPHPIIVYYYFALFTTMSLAIVLQLYSFVPNCSQNHREANHDIYGKRQKWNSCRLSSAVCKVEWNYLYLQWIGWRSYSTFVCFIYGSEEENSKSKVFFARRLPSAVTSFLTSLLPLY